VTNHWLALMAHKFNDKMEMFLFDSRNRDYLEWDEARAK